MSKLPKAPLVEVVFELKWEVNRQSDILDFQYLHGDLYANLRERYPIRQHITPAELPFEALRNMPVFRFRKNGDGYPLIQVGPGILTINVLDKFYVWEEFRDDVHTLINVLEKVYPKFTSMKFVPALVYIDFLKYGNNLDSGYDFLNENLNININSNILLDSNPKIKDVNINTAYKVNNDDLIINIREGKAQNTINGLIVQTRIMGDGKSYNKENLKDWLETAHRLSSDTFKSLIKEDLYNSYK